MAAAFTLAVSGCGGPGGVDRRGPAELITAMPPAKHSVDLVKWALPFGEPLSLDPAHAFGESEETVLANLCESVLRMGPDNTVRAGLATRADWRDDTTFVIDVRPGVTFWDGTPMTADDVAYSLRRNIDPKVQSSYAGAYRMVSGIRKTGPMQVTVTFKQHDAQFRNAIASYSGTVMERRFAAKAGKGLGTPAGGLMCTGPYKLGKWSPGDKISIARNGRYWDGAPKVENLDFQFITDSSTLTSALLAGEVDGTFNAPVESVNAFRNSDQGDLVTGPSSSFVGFFPTTAKGPAADPLVRQALNLSLDKQAFIDNVLMGYGTPLKTMTPPIVWEGIPGHAVYRAAYDRLPDNRPDLGKAKALIAEAKLKPGQKRLVFAMKGGDTLALQAATLIQAAARALGFDATIHTLQPTDFDAFFFDASKRATVDFVVSPGWIEVPGALYYAPEYALADGVFNYSRYHDPEVTKLLHQARTSTDPNETARLFTQAQAKFTPANLFVPLANSYMRVFLNRKLTGVTTSSAYLTSPWAARLGGK
ncbi:ABC transporter substrate-binding protein [Streptomyces sp. NPDC055955]|uniref:ABC transporter substrate-binding protein n=1 Tax=Streptomyces sp. NPDC055955 TaxID=3345665 RepID=UPI0035D6F27D